MISFNSHKRQQRRVLFLLVSVFAIPWHKYVSSVTLHFNISVHKVQWSKSTAYSYGLFTLNGCVCNCYITFLLMFCHHLVNS